MIKRRFPVLSGRIESTRRAARPHLHGTTSGYTMRQDPAMTEPEWKRLAREYGGIDERGNLRVDGRFLIDTVAEPEGRITARLITPLAAGIYTDDLQPKRPPFLFDRARDGRVILPGRWFLAVIENIRDDPTRPAAERDLAARARNAGEFQDAHVAASQVTRMSITWAATGEEVGCELLLPPFTLTINLRGF
jgi:hypothetical protein